jgi:hypothetical protein
MRASRQYSANGPGQQQRDSNLRAWKSDTDTNVMFIDFQSLKIDDFGVKWHRACDFGQVRLAVSTFRSLLE